MYKYFNCFLSHDGLPLSYFFLIIFYWNKIYLMIKSFLFVFFRILMSFFKGLRPYTRMKTFDHKQAQFKCCPKLFLCRPYTHEISLLKKIEEFWEWKKNVMNPYQKAKSELWMHCKQSSMVRDKSLIVRLFLLWFHSCFAQT